LKARVKVLTIKDLSFKDKDLAFKAKARDLTFKAKV